MLACMFSANQGAEQTGQHPLELVTEDAIDDEVDGAVDSDQKIVGLGESVIDLADMLILSLKLLNQYLFLIPLVC